MHRMLCGWAILSLILVVPLVAGAGFVEHELAEGDASIINHWPGPDGLIGTADDLVDGNPSPINGSSANSPSSFSYNAFDFDGVNTGQTETTRLPSPMNAATFLSGNVTVNTDAFAGSGINNVGIISGWNINGTEPFPGHGSYSASLTAVNSGSYDTNTSAFTINVDFSTNLLGGSANAVSFDLAGTAVYVESADFGTATGNNYVDTILLPMAQSRSAASLIYIHGTGTVPQSTGGSGGSFPEMPIEAVLVGVVTSTAVEQGTWGQVKGLFQ